MGRRCWPVVLPALLLLVLLGGAWLISVPAGLTGTLALADYLLPGQLRWREVRGRLSGPLTVEGLHYDDGQRRLTIGHLQGNWSPAALVRGSLRIDRLRVRDLELMLPASQAGEPERFSLPDLHLPLNLEVWEAHLENLQLHRGDSHWSLARIELQATSREGKVHLETLRVAGTDLQLEARGQLITRGDYPLTLDLSWWLELRPQLRLEGRGRITGNLAEELAVYHHLDGIAQARLDLVIQDSLTVPSWSGGLELLELDLGAVSEALTDSSVVGQLSFWGRADWHHIQGELSTVIKRTTFRVKVEAKGDTQALEAASLILDESKQPRLEAWGQLEYPTQAFTLLGHWSRTLTWPPAGEARFSSHQGRFRLNGTLAEALKRL